MINSVSLTANSDWLNNVANGPKLNNAAQTLSETPQDADSNEELREVFDQFVGQTFYGQLFKAMRQTVDKPAYFHGGKGEEVFQQQLDQVLGEKMTEATSGQFTGAMFQLFDLGRG